jgi:flagellar motor switch protein FliN/FliY
MSETEKTEQSVAILSNPPSEKDWTRVLDLVCDLTIELPLPHLRVADWLVLRERTVIDSRWRVGNDVPLRVNGELLGWCEFEIVENRLAVRLTELA